MRTPTPASVFCDRRGRWIRRAAVPKHTALFVDAGPDGPSSWLATGRTSVYGYGARRPYDRPSGRCVVVHALPGGCGASASAERVLDAHSAVVLAVAEILGKDDIAAEGAGRFEDRRIPVRDA